MAPWLMASSTSCAMRRSRRAGDAPEILVHDLLADSGMPDGHRKIERHGLAAPRFEPRSDRLRRVAIRAQQHVVMPCAICVWPAGSLGHSVGMVVESMKPGASTRPLRIDHGVGRRRA